MGKRASATGKLPVNKLSLRLISTKLPVSHNNTEANMWQVARHTELLQLGLEYIIQMRPFD